MLCSLIQRIRVCIWWRCAKLNTRKRSNFDNFSQSYALFHHQRRMPNPNKWSKIDWNAFVNIQNKGAFGQLNWWIRVYFLSSQCQSNGIDSVDQHLILITILTRISKLIHTNSNVHHCAIYFAYLQKEMEKKMLIHLMIQRKKKWLCKMKFFKCFNS